jgi:hypothetical protein
MTTASQWRESAAWLAVLLTGAAILLLAALHVLSPEFPPSWRVISEYAFGRYPWVLSLLFLCMGTSSWALAAAIWPEAHTSGGKTGLWLLLIAGLGGAMASIFDVTHEIGHAIAGFLGVIGANPVVMACQSELDQCRVAGGDAGHHDHADGAT